MKKIVILAGDGIGPEIMDSALKVFQAASPTITKEYTFEAHVFGGAYH
ncbi:isocitrate/isopropylmalate family dehydrogenase [Enterococcus cecorum]